MDKKICFTGNRTRTQPVPMKAELHIQVAERGGSSYLKKAYFTTPYKVANITEDKSAQQLDLMLMSSSPGILDGDTYEMKIEVEQNCFLKLHSQAYQRIFHMKVGATQELNVHMEDGASFCYLPHPCVPHEQSIFKNINNFFLGNDCEFVFGEILTCGRKLNGEVFLFSKYHSITKVFVNERLLIKENLLMQPRMIDVHAIGQLEGYTHQASMIFLHPSADCKNLQSFIIEFLLGQKNIEFGVSMAPSNGLIIRLLGHGAEKLHHCLQRIHELINCQTVKALQDES
jgi:urease accessory protein